MSGDGGTGVCSTAGRAWSAKHNLFLTLKESQTISTTTYPGFLETFIANIYSDSWVATTAVFSLV